MDSNAQDVKRLNGYFCDKEEEVVIWLQQLDDQLAAASTIREKQLCHIGYIHLHGAPRLVTAWGLALVVLSCTLAGLCHPAMRCHGVIHGPTAADQL